MLIESVHLENYRTFADATLGGHGQPWHYLDFTNGKGTAVTNAC